MAVTMMTEQCVGTDEERRVQLEQLQLVLRHALSAAPSGDLPSCAAPPFSLTQYLKLLERRTEMSIPVEKLRAMAAHSLRVLETRSRESVSTAIDGLRLHLGDGLVPSDSPGWVSLHHGLRAALYARYGSPDQTAQLAELPAAGLQTPLEALAHGLPPLQRLAARVSHWRSVLDMLPFGSTQADGSSSSSQSDLFADQGQRSDLQVDIHVELAFGSLHDKPASPLVDDRTYWRVWLRLQSRGEAACRLSRITLAEDLYSRGQWADCLECLPAPYAHALERIATRDVHISPPIVLHEPGSFARIALKMARVRIDGALEAVPPSMKLVEILE